MDVIPPSISVALAALYHHLDPSRSSPEPSASHSHRKRQLSRISSVVIGDILPAAALYTLPPHSTAALLRPCTKLLRQWPALVPKATRNSLPKWLIGKTGPFGYGCGKFCETICAYFLLSSSDQSIAFKLGPLPGRTDLLLVLLLSLTVNMVLSIWSRLARSKGNHKGVTTMSKNSLGRNLATVEHVQLALLAFGNAFCEEVVSRGFFYHEFRMSAQLSSDIANVAQALAFGIWHYNGIPSGFSGVGLTFVYGLIMGVLKNYGGGLLLPIIAHTVADYFIFAVIVRRKTE